MSRDYRTVIRDIRAGTIRPVYYLEGNDFFLHNFFVGEVKKVLSKKGQVERLFLVPETGDYDTILKELNTVSLFPQPKLFILHNPLQIRGRNREELLAYCDSPNSNNCLVILVDKSDPGRKLTTELTRRVDVINASTPFPEKMAEWIDFLLRQHELEATDDAIHTLLELSGDSLYHLSNEIAKIQLNLGDRKTLQEADVLRYAGWKRSFFPWQFLDAIGNRDFNRAVLVARSILSHGSDISILISFTTTFFQELLFVHLRAGTEEVKKPRRQWLSRQIWQRLPKYQKLYIKGDVERAFRVLAKADREVKSGGSNSNAILISLIYRITSGDA